MSANIKASVDGTQAIIGVGGVDQMTVSNAGVVTANSFVGLNGSSVTATGSTTARTLANRFADVVNVKDFGAVGDGVADDSAAFLAAHTATPNGKPIYVPPGNYKISTTINCIGRHWIFEGSTFFPLTNLNGALNNYIDVTTGAVENGVGNPYQYGSRYKFGGNHHGPIGLQIGGAEKLDGPNGMMAFADGYGAWTTLTPSQYPSSAEFAVQPTSIAGSCSVTIGGNTVTKTGGGDFIPEVVGKRFYLSQGLIYTIDTYISPTQITVKNLNGTPSSFPATGTFTFVIVYCKGSGICNTNGTTVTRVSGDPFINLPNGDDRFTVNGVSYSTTGTLPNQDTIILASSAGVQNNVSYEFFTTVDNISSAIRVHRIAGAGFEENVTLGAYADGYFHLQAAGGVGRQYPFFIGSGYDSQGKRKQITIDGTSGNIGLGGNYDRFTLECNYLDAPSNWTYFQAGTAGVSGPTISSKGPDANIDLTFSTKGTGVLGFFGNNFGSKQFEITTLSTGTSWLGVRSDSSDQPRLYAAGSATNIDISLIPKGTGRVLIGPWTTNSDVAVNGYIEVKDSSGSIRKIATIA